MSTKRRIPLIVAGLALTLVSSAAALLGTRTAATAVAAGYNDNLAMLQASSVRNQNHDDSSYRDVAMSDLVISDHLGPRSEYLNQPAGTAEHAFPVLEGGQFRTSCEFSHFAYDDPIVAPDRPGAAHLHMFWGNTDTNAHSTYETLLNSGSGTCQGQELNRTGYWAPALFDTDGNVRIPERIIVYYKGYGLANGRSEIYPPGAAMISSNEVHTTSWNEGGTAGPDSGEGSFMCSNQWRGDRTDVGETIPMCDGSKYFDEYGVSDDPHRTLEMHVKFGNCWNREDPADPGNWGLANVGGWFYSECEGRATTPNIEYIIVYPLEVGETTDGWYLSSDVDSDTGEIRDERGTSGHADWWGAWHPEVNQTWLDNCVNFSTNKPSGCGMGYLSDGGPDGESPLPGPALRFRPQYEGPIKVPATTLLSELCPRPQEADTGGAYCAPNGTGTPATTQAPPTVPTTTTTPPTTVAPTTTAPPSSVAPTQPSERYCRGKRATIVGSSANDLLIGTSGDDVIWAGPGDDVVRARSGNDIICLGTGDDTASGGPGNDRIFGHRGSDRIAGGGGLDILRGGLGTDTIWGGPGADVLRGGPGSDRLQGGADNDRLFGGSDDDVLVGNGGSDFIRGGWGTDEILRPDPNDNARI